jgi:hypothetical protein
VMSRHQSAGQNRDKKMDNSSSEVVTKFEYLAMILIYQIYVHEEINNRLT